jgi:phospholipid/cholesterol/gamma-HCH transport system substrate-binding protein
MSRNHRHEAAVGALLLFSAVLTGWMALKIGAWSGLGDRLEVEALFEDVSGLKTGAAVTVSGVEVGRVSRMEANFEGARVFLDLDPEAGIPEDVTVHLRARSILGEKYLALVSTADGPPLESGAVLGRTVGQLEIDQLVNQLGPLVEALNPEGLRDSLAPLWQTLEEDPERIGRLLQSAEALLSELRHLVGSGEEVAQEAQLAAERISEMGGAANRVVARADDVLAELEIAVGELPATTGDLPILIDDARAAIADTRVLLDSMLSHRDELTQILANLSEIDKWELRRLLREEGILVRMRQSEVTPDRSSVVVEPTP